MPAGWRRCVARFPPRSRSRPKASGIDGTQPCVAGQSWHWDGVHFRVLHPTPYFPYLGNEASCVLRIETRHGAALLTGDIGEIIERGLVRRDPDGVRAEVVMVAHHGSAGSSDPAFVAATGARHALVSSGYGNRFGHPKPTVVARWREAGAEIHDTAAGGALRVSMAATGISVETRRKAHPRLWDAVARADAGLSYRP
jgi:competence protein ComEC